MNREEKAKQIEKLLSKLLFDKKNVKIDVEPISSDVSDESKPKYSIWRKYVVIIHVDPFKFNNVTNEFNEDYWNFIVEIEDTVANSLKYIGVNSEDVATKFVIDNEDEFIKMMEKLIYQKWKDVEKEYKIETGKDLPDVDELVIRQRGSDYPEFVLYVGLKKELFGKDHEAFWNALQETLPISEMFLQIV